MADRWRRYVRPELAPWCQPDGANDPYEYVLERFKNGGRRNLLRLCLAHDAMYIMAAELRRCSRDRRQEFMERLISHDAMHRAAADLEVDVVVLGDTLGEEAATRAALHCLQPIRNGCSYRLPTVVSTVDCQDPWS